MNRESVAGEYRDLLLELSRLKRCVRILPWGVMEDSLSHAGQLAFGARLVDLVECIGDRALRTPMVIEGEAV